MTRRGHHCDELTPVCQVGATVDCPVDDFDLMMFDKCYDINTKGTLFVTSELLKVMSKQDERFVSGRNGQRSIGKGAIATVTSLAGPLPVPKNVHYCASKAAAGSITEVAGTSAIIRWVASY